ncbi:beta-glucuronosyltransferase GlcAT14A-like isoform X2 [Carica papaya]|uniref:beta-glucuronosyltransferase GlcAT14A-like isoform X2 n=1 Tax=Carica papaya TaxID=3649 RepID=UPI000B8CE065|nr:beta-glucuronosyltransferase GlcAT14A-like isoform X2 [Carica papaya]
MRKLYRKLGFIKYPFTSMRKNVNVHSGRVFSDRKWIIPFYTSLLVSIILLMSAIFGLFTAPYGGDQLPFDIISFARSEDSRGYFVESDINQSFNLSELLKVGAPRLAYLISGTKGDSQRMMRTLLAVYHPRNQYILHLDLEAPPRERLELAMSVKNEPIFREVENVRVMAQSNLVTYKGPTMIACTLQAIAILLKESLDWDWFLNLSASDYPLVTQDDFLYALSNVSRNFNFIEHSQITGWKLNQRAKPIIIDPGLYLSKKSDIAVTTQRRSLPTSFKLFTEGYFHTVICNNEVFRSTAVSHDLHYIAWDNPPKQHPISLSMKDFDKMVKSKAPFARKFRKDDPVLDKIDKELLGRTDGFAPGAWCIGSSENGADPCSIRGDDSVFRPGPGAERLRDLFQTLLSKDVLKRQCS